MMGGQRALQRERYQMQQVMELEGDLLPSLSLV